ncbi:MAG: hypothetical protein INF91_10615 [Alphaproteobacteria bacterium]|nr:hypothetical protein [Alphaproteobacteria bacterium]
MPRWFPSPEEVSARRGRVTLLNAGAAACFSWVAISNLAANPERGAAYLLLWAIWLAVPLIWVFGIPGGRRWSAKQHAILNDELVRAQQATAARAGLALALALIGAGAACGFLGIALPVWAAPAAGSIAVIGTALVFAWLQLRDD